MKNLRHFWPASNIMLFLVIMMGVMTAFTAFVENPSKLLLIHCTVTAFSLLAVVLLSDRLRSDVGDFLEKLTDGMTPSKRSRLTGIPLPSAVLGKKGELIWYNEQFKQSLLGGAEQLGTSVSRLCDAFDMDSVRSGKSFQVHWGDRWWSCSCSEGGVDKGGDIGEGRYIVYFSDITGLKRTEENYIQSRPTVMIVVFDNEEELLKARENERMSIISAVDSLINRWAGTDGICWADAKDKSLIVVEERVAKRLIDEQFKVLEEARRIIVGDGTPVTLSIGVGRGGATIDECESWARTALDMALGRGGDQAVVRDSAGYSFFGGVANSSESSSRVRIRMNAAEFAEMIEAADNCIVMGHRYSDLDALGAAIGVYSMVKAAGKEVFIAVDKNATLAGSLLKYYEKIEGAGCFIDPTDALDHLRSDTLVVVVDTHSRNAVENAALAEKANPKRLVIIDHHRLCVDRIAEAELLIHEPAASSACEIVSELANYINPKMIGKAEADALLAGIMLDTKNFVLRTGVRTFEASAFLKRRNADTVEVRRMFSESFDTYMAKCKVVQQSSIYKNCAVSVVREPLPNIRIACSQAADDMLTISDVQASFVMYDDGKQINISARSLGKVNVQLIMERLHGGGHLTMAATQLPGETLDGALKLLYESIDKAR